MKPFLNSDRGQRDAILQCTILFRINWEQDHSLQTPIYCLFQHCAGIQEQFQAPYPCPDRRTAL